MAKTLLNNTNNAHGDSPYLISKLRQYCYKQRQTNRTKRPKYMWALIHERWDSLNKREGQTIH